MQRCVNQQTTLHTQCKIIRDNAYVKDVEHAGAVM